jgi:hypothetical protein
VADIHHSRDGQPPVGRIFMHLLMWQEFCSCV